MTGAERITAERKRQIEEEGWTAEHDRRHSPQDLIAAGIRYAFEAGREGLMASDAYGFQSEVPWPWDEYWWKPCPHVGGLIAKEDAERMLEKAGALMAAAIDRMEQTS